MKPVLDRLVLNVLTGASVSVGEAEVVDSVQSQQVVEKLLLLILTAEECVALVLAPATAAKLSSLGHYWGSHSVLSISKPYLSNAVSESRARRCLDRSFFSSESRTHALA
jgi:aromatic ring hydroxylase